MEHRVLIYQIGRLEANVFEKLRFAIGDNEYQATLSSFAIGKDVGRESAKVVLIYPVSLFFNESLLKNPKFIQTAPEGFKEKFDGILENPHVYLDNPKEYFQEHPHSREADDFFVIHSIGTYKTKHEHIAFATSYADIWLEIFAHMVEKYLNSERTTLEYVVDISSGFNIYVSALIEAARNFGVFLELAYCGDKSSKPKITLAFSDPVLPGLTESKHNIYFEPLRVRSIFASPVSKDDIQQYSLSRSLFLENRTLKGKFQSLLEGFVIAFSSIKNNTPLAIYQFGYADDREIKEVLNYLVAHIKSKASASYTSSPNLNRESIMKAFLSMAFYWGLIKVLKQNNIFKIGRRNIDLDFLKKTIEPIYQSFQLMLNEVVLGNEVSNLKVKLKCKDSKSGWTKLSDLLDPQGKRDNPHKRNFFAHSGFEREVTIVRNEGEKIFVKYDDRHHETIRKWLIDSI